MRIFASEIQSQNAAHCAQCCKQPDCATRPILLLALDNGRRSSFGLVPLCVAATSKSSFECMRLPADSLRPEQPLIGQWNRQKSVTRMRYKRSSQPEVNKCRSFAPSAGPPICLRHNVTNLNTTSARHSRQQSRFRSRAGIGPKNKYKRRI